MKVDTFLGAWVAAGLTLFIYSFLYKDNPFFKFSEHLYVGISLGYTVVRIYYDVMLKTLYNPLIQEKRWWLVFPAILGLLILTRFISRIAWLSRISFAFVVGFGSGVAIPRYISSFILQQVEGTLKPLVSVSGHGSVVFSMSHFNAFLILLGVVTVLIYFFFSMEHKGVVAFASRIGVYFLMISFGAAFGYTVMARMSLLIGRFDDLILFSARDFGYASLILLGLISICLAVWERSNRRR